MDIDRGLIYLGDDLTPFPHVPANLDLVGNSPRSPLF
jgi:hypothetical protein